MGSDVPPYLCELNHAFWFPIRVKGPNYIVLPSTCRRACSMDSPLLTVWSAPNGTTRATLYHRVVICHSEATFYLVGSSFTDRDMEIGTWQRSGESMGSDRMT